MTLYLNRLYQVIEQVVDAMSAAENQEVRSLLALMQGKARTLKGQIEERLRVRN